MLKMSGFIVMGSLLLAGPVVAQTADGDGTLSYDQTHVEALFQAQDASGETLTREQIASYRSESGWGKAFKQMQADGYYEGYKNLGQVISSSRLEKVGAYEARGFRTENPQKVQKPHRVTRFSRPNRPNRPVRPNRR